MIAGQGVRVGQRLRTDEGHLVVVWSAAPGSGCYWCHLLDEDRPTAVPRMVKVRIARKPHAPTPSITVVEDA